ncbi:MAG TPA: MFS transporter [Kouleothrix sp.]|uniref:MFS transporter n=1 Tax=Kouleothrix sp. TaxID=2779161 RepID=UPI002C3EFE6C|nr:MFS transporter [Kouleothrix sp.]
MATMARAVPSTAVDTRTIWKVILASALGTMIEWYDFYIFGSLATVIASKFFPAENATAALLSTLATFGAGFAARPFGALVFGRIGDLVGRKYAFLVTLLIMGGATTLIGLLPTYASIGILAPILLVFIRIMQGLALGGEYGGAAVYVAEHVPDNKRGYYTSFIQITATLGLFVSLAVILIVRGSMPTAAFADYGWRIPFLLSILLVGISVYIRSKMKESPLFTKLKSEGKTSTAPIKDSFGKARNWRTFFIVLLGAAAGQAVVWYTGQFYVNTWMKSALKLNATTADTIVAIALLMGMPFFVVFGALSDRFGRKKIMMAGNLLAAIGFYPIFQGIKAAAGAITPEVKDAAGKVVTPAVAANPDTVTITLLIFLMLLFVTMVYGPIAAFLVESFPAKIRYTSVSLPYHFGNGYFGGWLPFIATALVASTGNIYAGLWFPIGVAIMTFVVGMIFLKETNHVSIHDETEESYPSPA